MEAVPGRQYKPRHRKLVPLEEQDLIVKSCQTSKLPQKEVAKQHRVKLQLVEDLVAEAKHRPEKQRKAKEMRDQSTRQREEIIA